MPIEPRLEACREVALSIYIIQQQKCSCGGLILVYASLMLQKLQYLEYFGTR